VKYQTKNRMAIVGAGLMVGIWALTITSCAKPTTAASTPAPPEVEVAVVEQKDSRSSANGSARSTAMVNAVIKAQVTGYLLTQNYTEGSFVRKGQLLFEIDPRPFQAAVDQATGQLAQATAQLSQAKAAWCRRRRSFQARVPISEKHKWMRIAIFRWCNSRPSRSKIWTTPSRPMNH